MNAAELNRKIELWGVTESIDDFKNPIRTKGKIKDIWVKITPKHGNVENIDKDDKAEVGEIRLVIRCRKLSIPAPSIEMYFRRGDQTYEIVDFVEDMRDNAFWEFGCKIKYE